jgi:hypothetical protein
MSESVDCEAMMICPQCKAEYRRGFTVCADCDLPLLESAELAGRSVVEGARDDGAERERFAGTPGDPNTDPFCSFWKGTDLRVCTEICAVLDEAGIAHKMIRRQDHLFNWSHQSPYQIGVPASLYEKAELAIKEAFGTDSEAAEDTVHLLPPPAEDPRAGHLRSVWVGNQDTECASVCRELKEAGIYYRLDEERELGARSKTKNHYEISVAEADYERANAITGGVHPVADLDDAADDDDEDVGQDTIEAPDDGGDRSDRDGSRRRIRDEDWYPEDATSLAWEGEPAAWRDMIEMSLQENDIRMRWEMEDGKPKLFVLPEHEERAKEIVREILEEKPLE